MAALRKKLSMIPMTQTPKITNGIMEVEDDQSILDEIVKDLYGEKKSVDPDLDPNQGSQILTDENIAKDAIIIVKW